MRLQSIRLHPFGRFADEFWDLSQPLVVVHGPNELGKTTLRQAIFHALFTPTKKTVKQLEKNVGPWLPLPDGDHAAVTLTFTHGGSTWTLEKRWGAGQASRLSDGTTSIADQAAVQQRLEELLVHGEATFRHVLFTGQAELERTLEAIDDNATEIRDVRDLLKAGARAAADVDEHQLRQKLDAKIAVAFGRWNDEHGRPDYQDGQEKGIHNKWINGLGTILRAWYAWQDLAAEHDEVLTIERDIDDVTRSAAEDEKRSAEAAAFLKQHGHLRADLNQRSVLDERLKRLEENAKSLGEIYNAWPEAEAAITQWTRRLTELVTQRDELQAELANARKRQDGADARNTFTAIDAAKRAWEQADTDAKKLPDPGQERIDAVRRLQDAITTAENQIAARKLAWRIEAAETGEVRIERGVEPAETLPVGPTGASGTADARVRVMAGGITLSVDAGDDDVEAILTSLGEDRKRLAKELEACNASTAADVLRMAERRRDAEVVASKRKAAYEGALGGKTYEQWAEAIRALDDLPATRDVKTIDETLEAIRNQLAEGKTEADRHRHSIADWEQAHTDRNALEEKLLDARAAVKDDKASLATLATLPEEFATPQALLAKLDEAQSTQLDGQKRLTDTMAKLNGLSKDLRDRRGEDLAEVAEAAERKFNRARAEGRAYLRIRQELDRIAAAGGDDPLEEFGATVAATFARITGGEATLEFDGQLPARVVRSRVSLPPDRLSQGGGGALALALRLALAEAYLEGGDGFVMLDDPLVHFDPTRMAVAADILREFAGKAQVIFFTCHDHHAGRLRGDTNPAPEPTPTSAG